MQIVDVKARILSTALDEPFAFPMGWVSRRSAVLVEVVTDDGITDWGESLRHGLQPPEIAAAVIDHALKPIWDCLGRALGKPVHQLLGGAYRMCGDRASAWQRPCSFWQLEYDQSAHPLRQDGGPRGHPTIRSTLNALPSAGSVKAPAPPGHKNLVEAPRSQGILSAAG